MHALRVLILVAISLAPQAARAACYSILDRQDNVVYQSTVSPIDLSQSISQEMSRKFPGHYLVFTDDPGCSPAARGSLVPAGALYGASGGSAAPMPAPARSPAARAMPRSTGVY